MKLSRASYPKKLFLVVLQSSQQIPAKRPSLMQLGMVPFQNAFRPQFLQSDETAENMFLCCLGPGMENRVSSTVRGLMVAHPTILARAEAAKGASLNFSSKILSGIKQRMLPIELLRTAGVSPFQKPFNPCCLRTMLQYPLVFCQMVPFSLGERMMAILKTSSGWKMVETMSPDVNPIPVCMILFLELEGLAKPGILVLLDYQHLKMTSIIKNSNMGGFQQMEIDWFTTIFVFIWVWLD